MATVPPLTQAQLDYLRAINDYVFRGINSPLLKELLNGTADRSNDPRLRGRE